jgi:hypothetical protein
MQNLLKCLDTPIALIKEIKSAKNLNQLMQHAIVAEAKFNNDLADLICRSNANKIAQSAPNLYSQFSIATSEVLIAIGKPAHVILGDDKAPSDEDIVKLDKSSARKGLYENKTPSELYEFYIRKCRLLEALNAGNGLTATRVSLQQRCKNIRLATTILIRKCLK